jgi:hypothetical protein
VLWSAVVKAGITMTEFRKQYSFSGDWGNEARFLVEEMFMEDVEDLLLE